MSTCVTTKSGTNIQLKWFLRKHIGFKTKAAFSRNVSWEYVKADRKLGIIIKKKRS